MTPVVVNTKYIVRDTLEDGSLLVQNFLNGCEYIFRRVPASDIMGRKDIQETWQNSLKAVSSSFISYEAAGVIISFDDSIVSKEGYFLVEPNIVGDSLSSVNLTPEKLASIIQSISTEIWALSYQKLAHGNLRPSSIVLNKRGIMLRGSNTATFVRGKPQPKKELSPLVKAFEEMGIQLNTQAAKAMNHERTLVEIQSTLQRKACPSSWLLGIERIPLDIAYRLSKSRSLGCSVVLVRGSWDHSLDIIASEVSVLREIAGRITFLLESQNIKNTAQRILANFNEFNELPGNPIISFLSKYSHLPIEIILLHRTGDDSSIISELNKVVSLHKRSGMSLVVFSEGNIDGLDPDYVIRTLIPIPDSTIIAERSLSSPEKAHRISQFQGISPLEAYQLITGTCDPHVPEADEGLRITAKLLPGILHATAFEASRGLRLDSRMNSNSSEFTLAIAGRRLWPLSHSKPQLSASISDLSENLFHLLSKQDTLRHHEVLWLLKYSIDNDNPHRLTKAGDAFLRFWRTWGSDLNVESVVDLLRHAELFLKSSCTDDILYCFILDTIERFYLSTAVIINLLAVLQPVSKLANRNPKLSAAIYSLTIWAAFSSGDTENLVNRTLDAIKKTEGFDEPQRLLFRIFVHSTIPILDLTQEILLNVLHAYEVKTSLEEDSAGSAFFSIISAAVHMHCGNLDTARDLLQRPSSSDSSLQPWLLYMRYTIKAQLAAQSRKYADSATLQGKAHMASTFSINSILAQTSILSYDISLEFQGHYTRRNVLERMDWLRSVFRYFGARRLIAHIDCNLMISHFSLLNRNASLRHAESILALSSDLIKGNLRPCVYSFANFAFLTGQPERAVGDLKLLKKRGGDLVDGLLEGIEHFLNTNSTKMMKSTELIVCAETLKWLGTSTAIDEWVSALNGIESTDSSYILCCFRKGNLLQGYLLLLVGIASGDIGTAFLDRNKWLLQAVDTRFSRAGFLKLHSRKTPLEQITEYLKSRKSTSILENESYTSLAGNYISRSEQMCKKLAMELEFERVWVIRTKRNSIEVLSSSESKPCSFLPSWVTEALDWLNDSAADKIDISSDGWVRGFPRAGVSIIEIHPFLPPQTKQQLYVAVESLRPGKVLNKPRADKLALVSGLLAQSALYENGTQDTRNQFIVGT